MVIPLFLNMYWIINYIWIHFVTMNFHLILKEVLISSLCQKIAIGGEKKGLFALDLLCLCKFTLHEFTKEVDYFPSSLHLWSKCVDQQRDIWSRFTITKKNPILSKGEYNLILLSLVIFLSYFVIFKNIISQFL